ncbi:beta-glucosidase-related glycosidase [Anaeromyces robustus]|uniref:beta-glucosidase n=1 Tax=Anaeromyces robustus TaxID=1754192 RepID=A0A1Y1WW65_9FUNG|nr:beta-glucosidase-related glycosidase [Anaeromyces robustus]|eukprot:ORX77801.1 beta-glucosidase-related glycosidase [Anaeromyces robustus]
MKFFNILVIALLLINLAFAVPIKKKCIVKNKGEIGNKNDSEEIGNNNESEEIGNNNEADDDKKAINGPTRFEGDEIFPYETEHINTLASYTSECTVLLKKNGDFPLTKKDTRKVYLYGNGVRKTIKGGTGSGDVNSRSFDNIETAFTKGGFEILTKDFLDAYDEIYEKANKEFQEELNSNGGGFLNFGAIMTEPDYDLPYVKEGDLAIYVLSRISGEGTDRKPIKGDLFLTDTERKMINDLAKGFKKFMLVLNTGGPMDLSDLDSVENVLVLSQLGVNTSNTLVDVITGAKYPSGKLATTWTKYEDYQTIGDFAEKDDTNYKEGIYVGYRYFDTVNTDVMYPFGFGLGYTDFEYEIKSAKLNGETFEVKTNVKNVGKYKGKEVMELYLSKPNTSLDEPYQILVNFAKTKELKPKQKDTVTIKFKLSDFASYDTKTATYILDKGDYVVRVGNSSRNTKPCGVIKVKSRIDVRKVDNKLGDPGFKDYVPELNRKKENLSKVKKFTLNAKSIKKEVIDYEKPYEINEAVKALTLEEKAKLVIGAYVEDAIGSLIGAASTTVAGAAGETAKVAGLKPVVMADGPAGLRLAKSYFLDETGAHNLQGNLPESMMNLFDEETKKLIEESIPKPKEGEPIYHQYATAIPIGTAIAQSWNKEFARICGDIVGTEMEMFGVQLWLAPALNIHRSILCGRNFEYYSEDPYISGAITAAITSGVQKHKNAFVTLKHFAANNQETNRYLNSSNVSERAMREIYLKGFEIAVKEANPKAIMTSYNLINGIHSNESKDLTSDILRKEFGYKGIVMTDWVMKMEGDYKYPNPTAYKVIKATGDIFMPGSKADYENVLEAIKNNELTMEELEISATRIYNLAKEIEN